MCLRAAESGSDRLDAACINMYHIKERFSVSLKHGEHQADAPAVPPDVQHLHQYPSERAAKPHAAGFEEMLGLGRTSVIGIQRRRSDQLPAAGEPDRRRGENHSSFMYGCL